MFRIKTFSQGNEDLYHDEKLINLPHCGRLICTTFSWVQWWALVNMVMNLHSLVARNLLTFLNLLEFIIPTSALSWRLNHLHNSTFLVLLIGMYQLYFINVSSLHARTQWLVSYNIKVSHGFVTVISVVYLSNWHTECEDTEICVI